LSKKEATGNYWLPIARERTPVAHSGTQINTKLEIHKKYARKAYGKVTGAAQKNYRERKL